MKILLVTPLYSQHFDAGWFWFRAFQHLGHEVDVWDYRLDEAPVWKREYDLTLVLKGESVYPDLLPHPCFCYWPDAFNREPGIERKLGAYNKIFTPVRPTPSGMIWLPTGYDPVIHHEVEGKKEIASLYIGTNNSLGKALWLEEIGPRVVAGNGWGLTEGIHDLPPAYLHDFVRLASRAVVGIDLHQGEVGLNRKFFEMISCVFTITDKVPGVDEVLGKNLAEAVSFSSPQEAKVMIKHYLIHPDERKLLWDLEKKAIFPYSYTGAVEKVLSHL